MLRNVRTTYTIRRLLGLFLHLCFWTFAKCLLEWKNHIPTKSYYPRSKSLPWSAISLIRHRTASKPIPIDSPYPI